MKAKHGILGACVLAMVTIAGTAWAQHEQPTGEEAGQAAGEQGGKEDIAGYIFHHVADNNEWEIEVPLNPSATRAVKFPEIYIPIRQGATCPAFQGFRFGPPEPPSEELGHRPGLSDGCLDLSPTKHALMVAIAGFLVCMFFVFGTHKDKSQLVPRGRMANALEMLVIFARDELAVKNIGKEEGPRYTPYILSVFFFILFANLLGIFPWMSTPTGNLGVTAALAAITFILTQVASIRAAGVLGFLKHLTGGVHWLLWPIMIPVEILGLFTKPFALTMRLFANMVAGHVVIFFLLGLIFIMGGIAWAGLAVPFAFGIYLLEIFVAFLQAYIFAILSALFIGMGVAMGHHDHGEGEHAHEPEGAHSHDHGAGHQLSGG